MQSLLFVYGSLRRGEVNFPVLARAGGRFIGKAETLQSFVLEQGPRWRRLRDRAGVGGLLRGEIFAVETKAGWDILDWFEDHPHGYRRRLVRVTFPAGAVRLAWVYFFVETRLGNEHR